MEADEVDVFPGAVFGDFEEVEDTKESGCAGELRGDVGEADELNGVDFDLAFFHAVTRAGFHVGAGPEPDATGNLAAANALAEAFSEFHEELLYFRRSVHTSVNASSTSACATS